MKLQNLTELWLLDEEGNVKFHYPQSISKEKSGLLHLFLSGITKFMKDLGGDDVYYLSTREEKIIGIQLNLSQDINKNLVMVGAFLGKSVKKIMKNFKDMSAEFSKILEISPDFIQNKPNFHKIIKEYL